MLAGSIHLATASLLPHKGQVKSTTSGVCVCFILRPFQQLVRPSSCAPESLTSSINASHWLSSLVPYYMYVCKTSGFIKTEPTTLVETAYFRPLFTVHTVHTYIQYICPSNHTTYTVASAVTGLVFMRRFRLILRPCGAWSKTPVFPGKLQVSSVFGTWVPII